jgi:Spy/CpxP family protein refolding chaperone
VSRGRGTAALVLVLVALAGVLAGIALDRRVLMPRAAAARQDAVAGMPRHEMPRRQGEFRERFAKALGLTEAQRVAVDSLMDHQLRELRRIRGASQPQVESVIRQTRRAIDSLLTPEQRERAAELAERRRAGRRGRDR